MGSAFQGKNSLLAKGAQTSFAEGVKKSRVVPLENLPIYLKLSRPLVLPTHKKK